MAPDELLVERANAGDLAAFEAIVARHRPAMLARCRSVLDRDGAEDAVQHALLNAWNALRGGCEVQNLRAWLLTIARRCALQSLRSRGEPPVLISELYPGGPSPAEELDRDLRTRTALSAVAALPHVEREALVSTAIHGRSGREAADALGVSEGMVRQLVHRARVRVREAAAAVPAVFAPGGLRALRGSGRGRAALRWAEHFGAGAEGAPAQGTRLAARAAIVLAAGVLAGGVPLALHGLAAGRSRGVAAGGRSHARAAVPRAAARAAASGPRAARGVAASAGARLRRAAVSRGPAPHGRPSLPASAPAPFVALGAESSRSSAGAAGADASVTSSGSVGGGAAGQTPPAPSPPPAGTIAAPVVQAPGGIAQQPAPAVGAAGQTAGKAVTGAGEAVSQAGAAVEHAGEAVGALGGGATKGAGEVVSHTGEAVKHVGETVSGAGGALSGVLTSK
jgi:RNA polymerase sigma factor (sigma-70 family)